MVLSTLYPVGERERLIGNCFTWHFVNRKYKHLAKHLKFKFHSSAKRYLFRVRSANTRLW